MAVVNSIRKKERDRCAEIVRERRYEIERRLINTSAIPPKAKLYMRHMRRVIQMLTEIEHSILEIQNTDAYNTEKVEYLGNFSVEEMERAQAIIEEQEQNPFERETK